MAYWTPGKDWHNNLPLPVNARDKATNLLEINDVKGFGLD